MPPVMPEASFNSTSFGSDRIADAVDHDAGLFRLGKGHRLGLAVAREFAGDQEFDPDAVLGVPQVLAAGERGNVAEAVELFMDGLEALTGDENVDIVGQASEAMGFQTPCRRRRHKERRGRSSRRAIFRRVLKTRLVLLEMTVALVHAPPPIALETLFVTGGHL